MTIGSRTGNDPRPSRAGPPGALLGLMAGLGPFTIDSYLPALPTITAEFGAHPGVIQLTLAMTMLGFSIGQLLIGPWSDRVGRRLPLVIGLSILALACIGAGLARSPEWLLAARFLQGLGASSSYVVALASARDFYAGSRLVKTLGSIAFIQSLAPLVAPVVGGFLLVWLDWRGVFACLAVYALLVLFSVPRRLAGRAAGPRAREISAYARYRTVLSDRRLLVLLVLAGLRFTALYAFLQWSSFIFQDAYGLDAGRFGLLFAIITLGMMAGLQLSPLAIRRGVAPRAVLWAAYAVMAASAVALILVSSIGWVVVSCAVLLLGCGLGLPTVQTLALAEHPEEAGTVAGLIGAVGFGSALLASPALAALPAIGLSYQSSLSVVIAITTVLGAALVFPLGPTRAVLAEPEPSRS